MALFFEKIKLRENLEKIIPIKELSPERNGYIQEDIGIHTDYICRRKQIFAFIVSWMRRNNGQTICGSETSIGIHNINETFGEDKKAWIKKNTILRYTHSAYSLII